MFLSNSLWHYYGPCCIHPPSSFIWSKHSTLLFLKLTIETLLKLCMSHGTFGMKYAHPGSRWMHRVESEYTPCYPKTPLPRAFLVGLAILTLFGFVWFGFSEQHNWLLPFQRSGNPRWTHGRFSVWWGFLISRQHVLAVPSYDHCVLWVTFNLYPPYPLSKG